MKYIKSYLLFALMALTVTGCTLDDLQDDVNNLKDRVTLIEQQVKLLNDNLAVVGYILDAQNKTVSKVETVTEGGKETQHVITLSDGTKLTLTIGAPGTVNEPMITVGEDKMWYINGVSTGKMAVGEPGKNGEGFPEFRVEKGNWEVRFGSGSWSQVPGGAGVANGSLGDQIFESATVAEDGKNFVVTLKNGDVHTLPIVATLVCIIDKSSLTLDADEFLVIEKDKRVIIPVKIQGENSVVTYPQGWRAELKKMENVDANGNNYQLLIFAPAAKQSLTRASAGNAFDVTIRVQEGLLWAVDKIKVKNPKDYSNNLVKYEDGLAVTVSELEIQKDVYGDATEITVNTAIAKGGVYFVSTNNVTLTCGVTSELSDLIIIPTTADVTTIHLEISQQLKFAGTFVCQNVVLNNGVTNNYPLVVNKNDVAKVIFDKCKITNLVIGKGLATPGSGVTQMRHFEISNSDVVVENAGSNLYMTINMSCETLKYNNNLFYYRGIPLSSSDASIFQNLKLIQAATVKDLTVTSNTFIDVESATITDINKGLLTLAGAITGNVAVSNNLYYYTYRRAATQLLRSAASPNATVTSVGGNYIYIQSDFNSANAKNVFFTQIGTTPKVFDGSDVDFFDTTNPASFNKTTGVFVPKDGYTQYGAQR